MTIFSEGAAAIGWFTFALVVAGIAQGKNRSGLDWFLLSALLGPIALFILVAFCDRLPMPEKEPDKEP